MPFAQPAEKRLSALHQQLFTHSCPRPDPCSQLCSARAGTQADTARNNYLAVVRLVDLGQGRHGKKGGAKAAGGDDDSDEESSSEEDDDMSEEVRALR